MKKQFTLPISVGAVFDKLPDEKAGQLIKYIFQYMEGKEPNIKDLLLQVAFESIKFQLTRESPKTKQLFRHSIEERKSNFQVLIRAKIKGTKYEKNPKEVRKFYDYWCEHGDNDKKMRFEKENSFSVMRRLSTWFGNSSNFGNKQVVDNTILGKTLGDD